MNRVHVTWRGIERPPWLTRVAGFCRAVLRALAIDGWELSVLLAGDELLRDLNRRYRGIDLATDVLSFSQTEGEALPPALPPGPHSGAAGDVVISLPSARRQARGAGVPPEQELRRLLIHGILHLIGMDHPRGSGEMLARQEILLEGLEERLY